MMHVDTKDVSDGGVVECRDASWEVDCEGLGFGTIEFCVNWECKKDEAF